MCDTIHQRVAQRAGKRVICAHEELKCVQNFVSAYNANSVKIERIRAEPKSKVIDSTGVERALSDA